MIPSGKAHNEMLLNDYLGEDAAPISAPSSTRRARCWCDAEPSGLREGIGVQKLVIANKSYSSWSLRPWLLMKQLGIAFRRGADPARSAGHESAQVLKYSPAGKVPILVDGDVTVWETLAIMEYLADAIGAPVWPQDRKARAMARSVAAEMHAGFPHLRSACPMNLGKKYRDEGSRARCSRGRGALRRNRAAGAGALRRRRAVPVRRVLRRRRHVRAACHAARHLFHPAGCGRRSLYGRDAVSARFPGMAERCLAGNLDRAHDEVDEEPIENYRKAA